MKYDLAAILIGAVAAILLFLLGVSVVFRGRRRIWLQRFAITGTVPTIVLVLIMIPPYFQLTISDGLSMASLGLTVLLAASAGITNQLSSRVKIAIVIPSKVPFHSKVREGIAQALIGRQYDLHDDYLLTNRAIENLADFLPALRRTIGWKPDYMIICSPSTSLVSSPAVTRLLVEFMKRGGGIVLLDNFPPVSSPVRQMRRCGTVTSDVATGTLRLIDYITAQAKPTDEILVLAGPSSSEPAVIRRKLLEEKLPSAKVEVADTGSWTSTSTYQKTLEVLRLGARPRFIVCGNDVMALGAIRAVREYSMNNNLDPSPGVIGYDGIGRALFSISEPTSPFCATICTPPSAYGQEAVTMIIDDCHSVLRRGALGDVLIPVGEGQLITSGNVDLALED